MDKGKPFVRFFDVFATKDIYGTVGPVYLVCRLLGLYPVKSDNSLSYVRCVYTVSLLAFITLYYGWARLTEPCFYNYCFRTTVMSAVNILNPLVVGVLAAMLTRGRGSVRAVTDQLDALGRRLAALRQGPPHSRRYLFRMAAMFTTLSLHFVCLSIFFDNRGDFSSPHAIAYRFTQLYPFYLFYTTAQPFQVMTETLGQYFSSLSALVQAPHAPRHAEELLYLHHELCEIADQVEDNFGLQVLVTVSAIFLNATASLFLLSGHVVSFVLRGLMVNLKGIIFLGFFTSYWFIMFVQIVRPCEILARKAKEFSSALYNLMIEDRTKELVNNDKLQLHLMMKREVKFTACDVFPLDNALIHSMIAASTTYLVILIQFGPF